MTSSFGSYGTTGDACGDNIMRAILSRIEMDEKKTQNADDYSADKTGEQDPKECDSKPLVSGENMHYPLPEKLSRKKLIRICGVSACHFAGFCRFFLSCFTRYDDWQQFS
jgi:hypothetical protein